MTTPPTNSQSSAPKIDPKAFGATVVRYVVPIIVGLTVSQATKIGFHLDPTQAYAYVAPAVATGYSALAHFLEAKFPILKKVLGADKPVTLTK